MTYKQIFEAWKATCEVQENKLALLKNWNSWKEYTDVVLKSDNAMVYSFATTLGLNVHREYYSLDAVFYEDEDRVAEQSTNKVWSSINGNWLKRVRIAFEHENTIDGARGGYQEICHLVTTKADFKVLVGYIGKFTAEQYAEDFQSIIKSCGSSDSVLLILGSSNGSEILWQGYELTDKFIRKL